MKTKKLILALIILFYQLLQIVVISEKRETQEEFGTKVIP